MPPTLSTFRGGDAPYTARLAPQSKANVSAMAALVSALCLAAGLAASAATCALDFEDAAARKAQPAFVHPSSTGGCTAFAGPYGAWSYRFRITRPWCGELPQWPSVNLKPSVTDWSPYDRLVVDLFNDSVGGDVLMGFIAGPDGRIQNGLSPRAQPLEDHGFHRWVIPLTAWPATTDPKNIGRVHFFFTTPNSADVHIGGLHLLKAGEPLPVVSERFLAEKVRPALEQRERARQARLSASRAAFASRCRAVGQTGRHCWVGKATGMEKVRPREAVTVAAADSFALKLARGEYESLQVLVTPSGPALKGVRVCVSDLVRANGQDARSPKSEPSVGLDDGGKIAVSCFRIAPVGYVNVTNPAPYKSGYNVATNLPGGYLRLAGPSELGWWPDPILDWLPRADVREDDLQSFWVRLKCPGDQPAGTYRGTLTVSGEGWSEDFPLTVCVWNFAVPKASPLPLAVTYAPGPSTQFADAEQLSLAARLRKDPSSPVSAAPRREAEWGAFLADYYLTMDSLYHGGNAVHWDVLRRLDAEGRLGRFNLGYWSYPTDLTDAAKAAWLAAIRRRLGPAYRQAKALGLLSHAYVYGCDEVSPKYFPNIAWALGELRREFPGVPLSTTAYDHDFGVGSPLAAMDWFTPTTDKYEQNLAKIPAARAAGHQVWWYIACGQQAPRANLFVEGQAIEARQLMGAQAVKYRPDGFLYYQVSIWNSLECISGPDTFTTWEPRSWTRFHGDGSWFCCGPEGRPSATVRIENFRDGLEDYAYALEYERVTGRQAEVPPEVVKSVYQYTDDPAAVYAWRDRLAEAIEKNKKK